MIYVQIITDLRLNAFQFPTELLLEQVRNPVNDSATLLVHYRNQFEKRTESPINRLGLLYEKPQER